MLSDRKKKVKNLSTCAYRERREKFDYSRWGGDESEEKWGPKKRKRIFENKNHGEQQQKKNFGI